MDNPDIVCWPYTLYPWQLKVFTATYSILSLVIFLADCLLIALLIKAKQTSMVSNYFILAMSLSDVSLGGVVLPCNLIFQLYEISDKILSLLRLLVFALTNFSATMVLTIALDRYLHMYCLRYSQRMTHFKAKLAITIFIIFALGYATLSIQTCSTAAIKLSSLVGAIIYFKLLILTNGLYIRLCLRVRRSSRSIGQQQNCPGRNTRHAVHFTRTVLLILVSLSLCYMPYLITTVLLYVELQKSQHEVNIKLLLTYQLTICLVLGASGVNALILLHRNRAIRQYVRSFRRTRNSEL